MSSAEKIKALVAERDRLHSSLECEKRWRKDAEEDAERYRWLRNDPPVTLCVRRRPGKTEAGCYLDGINLDKTIDAAMAVGLAVGAA